MKNFGHNFTFALKEDCWFNNIDSDNRYKEYHICSICNLLAYKQNFDNDYFYAGKGVKNDAIVNITCDEYIIKSLLE